MLRFMAAFRYTTNSAMLSIKSSHLSRRHLSSPENVKFADLIDRFEGGFLLRNRIYFYVWAEDKREGTKSETAVGSVSKI